MVTEQVKSAALKSTEHHMHSVRHHSLNVVSLEKRLEMSDRVSGKEWKIPGQKCSATVPYTGN